MSSSRTKNKRTRRKTTKRKYGGKPREGQRDPCLFCRARSCNGCRYV